MYAWMDVCVIYLLHNVCMCVGIEFSVNSFNILLLGEILMYPIRFIKVMGRSKNNYGQVTP
jgi:hypothetical protein